MSTRRRIFLLLLIISATLYNLNIFSWSRVTSLSLPKPPYGHRKLSTIEPNPIKFRFPLPSPVVTDSILFPEWKVFVLTSGAENHNLNLSCLFSNGVTSKATYFNKIPSSSKHGYICDMPRSVRRLRKYYTPILIGPPLDHGPVYREPGTLMQMMRWNNLAYDAHSTKDDVVVFAKGVNRNQGKDRLAKEVTCVFLVNSVVNASTNATSSSQEVFRCPHPIDFHATEHDDVRVSVKNDGENISRYQRLLHIIRLL